jgi:intein/homing endonuclease
MADGTTKLVQDIQVGDKVLSISNKDKFFSTNKFRKSSANITGVNSILIDNVIDINNGLLTTSDSHINVIKRDGIWSLKTSNELLVGDILIDINKNEIKITSVNILYKSQQVYNITVDKEHMYFANNILTHNKTAPPVEPL